MSSGQTVLVGACWDAVRSRRYSRAGTRELAALSTPSYFLSLDDQLLKAISDTHEPCRHASPVGEARAEGRHDTQILADAMLSWMRDASTWDASEITGMPAGAVSAAGARVSHTLGQLRGVEGLIRVVAPMGSGKTSSFMSLIHGRAWVVIEPKLATAAPSVGGAFERRELPSDTDRRWSAADLPPNSNSGLLRCAQLRVKGSAGNARSSALTLPHPLLPQRTGRVNREPAIPTLAEVLQKARRLERQLWRTRARLLEILWNTLSSSVDDAPRERVLCRCRTQFRTALVSAVTRTAPPRAV